MNDWFKINNICLCWNTAQNTKQQLTKSLIKLQLQFYLWYTIWWWKEKPKGENSKYKLLKNNSCTTEILIHKLILSLELIYILLHLTWLASHSLYITVYSFKSSHHKHLSYKQLLLISSMRTFFIISMKYLCPSTSDLYCKLTAQKLYVVWYDKVKRWMKISVSVWI